MFNMRFLEWTRRTDDNLTVIGEPFFTDEFGRPEPVARVQWEAQAYNVLHGLPRINHDRYYPLDQQRAGRIADAYDVLPLDDSKNPAVSAAYQAFVREIIQQFHHAVASGMTFEPWTQPGEAYVEHFENGGEYSPMEVFRMVEDVKRRHLWYYTGGAPNKFMATTDPKSGLVVNDMFRAIHDYFGHCAMGADFGPRGEYNAWIAHMQMFTSAAQKALTVETIGQNCYVNFGRQNYDDNGNYLNILPQNRPYAIQKCAIFTGPNDWINHLPS